MASHDSTRPTGGITRSEARHARSERGWRLLALLAFAAGGMAGAAPAQATPVSPTSRAVHASSSVYRLAKKAAAKRASDADSTSADDSAKGEDIIVGGKGDKAGKSAPPKAGKSGQSLDNLMADVVSDDKTSGASKGKKRDDKEMDALLKDVQKTDPAPVVKKAPPPPPAPPLSPSDITTAMAQVKVRGKACAQRFGRGGTAELKVTVAKDGKVTNVVLGGKLAGTPVAGCIDQAVRSANFRPNAGLTFDYRMDVR